MRYTCFSWTPPRALVLLGNYIFHLLTPAAGLSPLFEDFLSNSQTQRKTWFTPKLSVSGSEEVEEIPKKSLGYSQQGMLDAATSSLGSHWWALLPPNQVLHKTSKENPFICCSERLVLLQERWRHYPEMFSSELGPGMSCWKESNIYSSTGTQRFVQGEICRHCTPLTPRAGVYGGLMI